MSILIVLDSWLNSYHRELLPRLSLRERLDGPACECDDGILAPLKRICDTGVRERGSWLTLSVRPVQPASARRFAPRECISILHLSFAHSPIVLTNQMRHVHATPMPTLTYQLGIFKTRIGQ